MKSVTKNTVTTSKQLFQCQSIIRSITHLDDISEIDKRMLFLTVNVENKHHLENIHKRIYTRINDYITSEAYKISPISPAMILTDDVEGSRNNKPQLVKPIAPHMHGLVIAPSNIKITDTFIVGMEHAIAELGEIRNISPTWIVDISISNRTHFIDVFISSLKQHYPQIKNVTSNENTRVVTLSISKEYLETASKLNTFMFDLKGEYSEIQSFEVQNRWQSVDIKRYDYKKSIFRMSAYASKLMDQTDYNSFGSMNYKSTVHPSESDIRMKANTGMKLLTNDNAHLLAEQILQNPSSAFSDEYLALYGAELDEMRDQANREKIWASNLGKTIERQIPVGGPITSLKQGRTG